MVFLWHESPLALFPFPLFLDSLPLYFFHFHPLMFLNHFLFDSIFVSHNVLGLESEPIDLPLSLDLCDWLNDGIYTLLVLALQIILTTGGDSSRNTDKKEIAELGSCQFVVHDVSKILIAFKLFINLLNSSKLIPCVFLKEALLEA